MLQRINRWAAAGSIVVLAACSSATAEEQQALERLEEQADDIQGDDEDPTFSTAEEACFEREGTRNGIDVLAALTDADAVDERVGMADAMLICLDDPFNDLRFVRILSNNFEAGLGGVVDISDEEGSCIFGAIGEGSDNVARALVDPTEADLFIAIDAMEMCLPPEDFAAVTGAEGTGPQTYGDDARLDRMWDDCEVGDDLSCDLLYGVSSIGSAYQDLAFDCAGRGANEFGWCADLLVIDDTGSLDASAQGTIELVAACEQGSFIACDVVYWFAPLGSDLENVGFTCGGLMPTGALPDCVTRLRE